MKFFKKIDNYLLHHYPAIWVTRIHSFLPIGLGLTLLIYLVNISIGWNPKDEQPNWDFPFIIMIIPVLVYLVYWFIFQSRYNVIKSGGKMNIGLEYLTYFLYGIVFFTALSFILVIPVSNDLKMSNAVSHEEVLKDIENLNNGNSIVNNEGSFEALSNGLYEVRTQPFLINYYSYDYSEPYYEDTKILTLSKREVLNRIEKYIFSYNKYVHSEITDSPQKILADKVQLEYYTAPYDDSYYEYGSRWTVEYKVRDIRDLYEGSYRTFWKDSDFWKIVAAIIGWLSLIVWIFKQMNLRHFIYGFISICLTPLFVAIIGFILFVLIFRNENEILASHFVLLAYSGIGFLAIRGFMQNNLNQSAYVLTMFFQFWLPILPLFLFISLFYRASRFYNYYDYSAYYSLENILFWVCLVLGIASIAVFKPIYAKFRSLPMKK